MLRWGAPAQLAQVRDSSMPLLGPALVLYLLADVAASHGRFEWSDYGLLLVVMALALPRRTAAAGSGDVRTDSLLRWLGLCSAVALLRLFSASLQRFSV